MYKKLSLITVCSILFAGCASVPLETKDMDAKVKEFNSPSEGKAGLYIFRYGSYGAALKKDVWVDGECIGETAPNIFFYHEVTGDEDHKVSTKSEFSPNDLLVKPAPGENHFIQQYIKMGVVVGGAGLKEVEEEKGKEIVSKLKMAKKGSCSK